ncbi:hypothetical protein FRC08_003968 [Ceratobasidium sp. 394]|nr:hypothetical protein FRC08_003968 [Ceratobasidium sp. 394]KAG9087376.1 hypothetical protein FS749_002951 [Ceratobasidium sp. UAMH 11750]
MHGYFLSLYHVKATLNLLNSASLPRPKLPYGSKLSPALKLTQRSEHQSPKQLPNPPLPPDDISRVADFLFEVQPPGNLDTSVVCCTKPPWADVRGFMSASPELHTLGYVRWLTVLTIRIPEDWDRIEQFAHRVRELRCLDGTFNSPQHCRILLHFEHLYAVSIDVHSDVFRNDQNQLACRDLVKAFPRSLRRLEISRAHGPDMPIMATIKEYCLSLEELRLGRCTMFNSPSACDFWRSFPFKHNLYMSTEDIGLYAHTLAQELIPLRSLTSLRLGLYLIPSATVLAHRLYHRHNRPAPPVIQWQQEFLFEQLSTLANNAPTEPPTTEQLMSFLHEPDPENEFGPGGMCVICIDAAEEISRSSEARASAILKVLVPSLEEIQWMNWFSPGHLGFSSYILLPSAQTTTQGL